jgi:hypothetical protein
MKAANDRIMETKSRETEKQRNRETEKQRNRETEKHGNRIAGESHAGQINLGLQAN